MDAKKTEDLLIIARAAAEYQRGRINAIMGREVIPDLDDTRVKFWSGSYAARIVFVVLERGGGSDWSLDDDVDRVRHTSKNETTVYAKGGVIDEAWTKVFAVGGKV